MDSIRKSIKNHLKISNKLHLLAIQLLRVEHEPGYQRKISDVAKENKLLVDLLRKKCYILRYKRDYYASKPHIERLVNAVVNKVISKTRALEEKIITWNALSDEIAKREKLGSSYQYNEFAKPGTGIFTYLEEASLLNDLNIWINSTQDKCHCQVCSLVHIMKIAYKLAKRENKDCSEWDEKEESKLDWICAYEMRHHDQISNLEGPNSCLLESQASTVSTSRGHLQEAISGTSRGHLQQAIPGTSSGHLQQAILGTSSGHLQQAIPGTSGGHLQEAISGTSSGHLQEAISGTSRGHLQQAIPGASGGYLQEAISGTSRGHLQQAISGTSGGHLQGDIEQQQDPNVADYRRESIKKHMNLSPRLTEAANQVLYKEKNIIDIALKDDLDLWILQRKVEISKRTNKYLEQKFVLAIQDYSIDLDIQNYNNEAKLYRVARKHDIREEYFRKHLEKELGRHLNSFDYYKYEQIIISYEVFTSEEEEKIIKQLYQRETECRCQLCVMEYLADLAYTFAKQEKIKYPSVWDEYKHVDELWLFEFEMRNSEQIARFPSISLCKRSPASSLHEQTEPTTTSSSYVQPKRPKLSKESKVVKSEESLIIEEWIKRHIDISDQLDEGAKQVLQKKKDIGRIAYEHKLDLWILNKKVNIIKFRKTQLDIKRKHEDAVNAVKLNILSVSDAAKKYKVDKDFIHDSLQKLETSDSNVYLLTYENLKTDGTMLKLHEEFKFLKYFKRQISNDPDCNCRSCALLKLPDLAYEFIIQNDPSKWNTTEKFDVIWTCEFVMRHSIEFSNYFQKECKADIVSTNFSESLTFDYQ